MRMKFMGSKRWMLSNGLGSLLCKHAKKAERFVDLFSGSSAVAAFVAETTAAKVLAFDLQQFSCVLARAVISRIKPIDGEKLARSWQQQANRIYLRYRIPTTKILSARSVSEVRKWCGDQRLLPITYAYGGHYFSPTQAVWIDCLRRTVPTGGINRWIALAALIQAASQCAAAPGHTAQPLQPTETAIEFVQQAWSKDLVERTANHVRTLAGRFALTHGAAQVMDANGAAKSLKSDDLVFIDPPYSGVHYSRFYHVLETIAIGECGEVGGVGRYPDPSRRPWSRYSVKGESTSALKELLETVASKGAKAILTFPDHECSNGLSGDIVRELAGCDFSLSEKVVENKFSTLGGTKSKLSSGNGRSARQKARELILLLKPR